MNAQIIEQYKFVEYETPNFGDLVFRINDWREEHPFKVVEVVKVKDKLLLCERLKEKYNIYNIFALSENDGFRNFTFHNNGISRSVKVKKNSKKEQYLKELIINK